MKPLSPSSTFCDWLTCTYPLEEAPFVFDSLTGFLSHAGFWRDGDNFVCTTGTVHCRQMQHVYLVSASGGAISHIRDSGLYSDYLVTLSSNGPHNVSRLDVAMDWHIDAQPVVDAAYSAFRSGISLSRKQAAVRRVNSVDQYGRDTGTVYFGTRGNKVHGRLYDKRHQVLDKGAPDPGPWLRFELELHVPELSLRDAVLTDPVFFHYTPEQLVVPLAGVPAWEPCPLGFTIERREADLMTDARYLIQGIDELTKLARLADRMPGEGVDVVVQMLRAELLRRQRVMRSRGTVSAVSPPLPAPGVAEP